MKKKILAAITTGLLTLALAQPANAATAGGSCTTKGATAMIGKNNYVCDKNPFFNTTKLTWVWDGCIELNNDYQSGLNEAQTTLRSSEASRFTQIEPVGADLRSLITWDSTIPYVKNEVVYYNSNYFVATKASTNKAPTSANLGSTKFWVVSNPTNANSKIGQMPAPAQVIAAANRQVAATTSAATKSTLISKIAKLENTKASIQSVVDTLDPVLTELKSAVSLVTITRGLVKDKCNPKY